MYRVLNTLVAALQLLALLCVVPRVAYAYVDPGSGLLAFQMIGTTLAGIIFVLRKRIRSLFLRKVADPKDERESTSGK